MQGGCPDSKLQCCGWAAGRIRGCPVCLGRLQWESDTWGEPGRMVAWVRVQRERWGSEPAAGRSRRGGGGPVFHLELGRCGRGLEVGLWRRVGLRHGRPECWLRNWDWITQVLGAIRGCQWKCNAIQVLFLFFLIKIFFFFAVLGLSCGTQDLWSSLWHAGSLVSAHGM